MATINKTFINQIAQKNPDGCLGQSIQIGTDFDSVVDTRQDRGFHTLAQFFDNYIEFTKKYTFVVASPSEPHNNKALIWLDTSQNNQSDLNIESQ